MTSKRPREVSSTAPGSPVRPSASATRSTPARLVRSDPPEMPALTVSMEPRDRAETRAKAASPDLPVPHWTPMTAASAHPDPVDLPVKLDPPDLPVERDRAERRAAMATPGAQDQPDPPGPQARMVPMASPGTPDLPDNLEPAGRRDLPDPQDPPDPADKRDPLASPGRMETVDRMANLGDRDRRDLPDLPASLAAQGSRHSRAHPEKTLSTALALAAVRLAIRVSF